MFKDEILDKAKADQIINEEEALYLLKLDEGLEDIYFIANEVNESINGKLVSYVVNRNINFSNVCCIQCKFCGFYKRPDDPEAYRLSVDEIVRRATEFPDITEVCMQGGIDFELTLDYYIRIFKSIKEVRPDIHIHALSPMEIDYIATTNNLSIEDTYRILKDAGLDSTAGTAAEILVDDLRKQFSPYKINTNRWIEIIKTAHRVGLRTTATIMFGHIDNPESIIRHLEIIKNIQLETGGFTEFIPLPFVPFKTKLAKDFAIKYMISFEKVGLLYAVSRLYFRDIIPNIQTSWVKLGVENAIRALNMGCNDFSGVLHEENITKSAGGIYGEYLSIEEIRSAIRKAGKIPIQRDTLYNYLEEPSKLKIITEKGLSL